MMKNNFVIAENKYNQKIVFDPNDHIGQIILREGLYDKKGLYYIEKILSKLNNPIVLDIGANIGNHALVMAKYAKMLYLFEPQKNIANFLRHTMELNNITNWKIFELGLSDEEKTLTLYKNLAGNNGASTFLPELKSEHFSEEKLNVCVGDDVVSKNEIAGVDFIKIDVEGFEAKVIAGLKNTIKKFSPIIIIEWNNEITKKQFEQNNLFNTVFNNYLVKTIISSNDKSRWYKKRLGKIRRFFYRKFVKKHLMIGEFIKSFDYQHVLFIPKNRESILGEYYAKR